MLVGYSSLACLEAKDFRRGIAWCRFAYLAGFCVSFHWIIRYSVYFYSHCNYCEWSQLDVSQQIVFFEAPTGLCCAGSDWLYCCTGAAPTKGSPAECSQLRPHFKRSKCRCYHSERGNPQKMLCSYKKRDWNIHRENAGTLGMVPLIINPIYTLYSGYLLGISPFKGLLGGLNS